MVIKIIHISDTHIGSVESAYEGKDCEPVFRETVKKIIDFKNKDQLDPSQIGMKYVVVHTGDIVDNANDDKYPVAQEILQGLVDEGFELFIVNGNHDLGSGTKGDYEFVRKFWNAFMVRFVKVKDSIPTFPVLKLVDNVAFVGLNSMEGEFHDNGGSTLADGSLGDLQRDRLEEMLSDLQVRKNQGEIDHIVVCLHHHPFETWLNFGHALNDRSKLEKILEKYDVRVLLFGHKHEGYKSGNYKKWNIPYCYDGSSTTGKREPYATPPRVIDLSVIFSASKII